MEKTWKPPESVMIGRSQRWNRCSPPSCAISSWPGDRNRWNVFPSTMSKPRSAASRTSRVLTTALVASGTNAGVRTSPWVRRSVPVRAEEPGSRVRIENTAREVSCGRAPRRRAPTGWCSALLGRGVGVDRLRRAADADRDLARLALLGLRDVHLAHAAVEARRHGLGIHALGQRQRAREGAERALDAVIAVLVLGLLGLALAGDRQDAVLDLDVDVGLRHARQVGAQH